MFYETKKESIALWVVNNINWLNKTKKGFFWQKLEFSSYFYNLKNSR